MARIERLEAAEPLFYALKVPNRFDRGERQDGNRSGAPEQQREAAHSVLSLLSNALFHNANGTVGEPMVTTSRDWGGETPDRLLDLLCQHYAHAQTNEQVRSRRDEIVKHVESAARHLVDALGMLAPERCGSCQERFDQSGRCDCEEV